MKKNKSKTLAVIMLTVMFMTGVVSKAEAKFWGNDTTSDWNGIDSNGCMVHYTSSCYYIMWIQVSCTSSSTIVACDEDGPDPCNPGPCPDLPE
jgi:hypothetical protein